MPVTVALRVQTPPAATPIDLDYAKRHLRIDHDDDDTLIEGYIAAATEWIEGYLGRALITTVFTQAIGDQPIANAWPMTPSPLLILPLAYSWPPLQPMPFRLLRSPVSAFGGIVTVNPDGTTEPLSPAAYTLDMSSEPSAFRLTGTFGLLRGRHLIVTYTAGYGAAPANVPASIQLAVAMLTAYIYENRGDMQMDDLPTAVASLVNRYRLVWFGA